MFKFIVLFFIPSLLFASVDSPKSVIEGHLQTRYDKQIGKDSERLQDAIFIRLKSKISNRFEFESLVENNQTYGLKYHSYYEERDKEWSFNDQHFAFKQIFFKINLESSSVFLGALKANDQIGGHTSFGNNSWVDGFRVSKKSELFKFSITVGSLNDLNLEITRRNKVLNYTELYFLFILSDNTLIESSMGMIKDEEFFRIAGKREMILSGRVIQLESEGLVNLKDNDEQLSIAISAASDLKGLDLKFQYSYGDPLIGLRGQVNDDRYMDDYNFQVSLAKKLGSLKQYKIDGTIDFRKDNRYQLSFRYDF